MSSAIARNIFRMFSACCCSWLSVLNRDSLVTPSTSRATSAPKRSSMSEVPYSVSFGHVVEELGLDRDRVEEEARQDLGRGDRVGHERLAGGPRLVAVGLDREVDRAPDRLDVGVVVALEDLGDQLLAHLLRGRVPLRGRGVRRPRRLGNDGGGGAVGLRARLLRSGRFRAVRLRVVRLGARPLRNRGRGALGDSASRSVPRRTRGRVRLGGLVGPRARGHHRARSLPVADQRTCSRNSPSAVSRSDQGSGPFGPMFQVSWPFPASRTTSAGVARPKASAMASRRSGMTRRSSPRRFPAPSAPTTICSKIDCRVLVPGVVLGDDHEPGVTRRRLAHEGALGHVALARGADDRDDSPTLARERRELLEDRLERARRVREVDDDDERLAEPRPAPSGPARPGRPPARRSQRRGRGPNHGPAPAQQGRCGR